MKYILDFDRTIFDMESLYKAIADTNPQAALGTLESLAGLDLTKFLFADAREFFTTHHKEQIHVVSSCYGKTGQWDLQYQKAKVERSLIADLVSSVHVVAEAKTEVIKQLAQNDTVVFVDDHPEHLATIARELPAVKTVYINRDHRPIDQTDVPEITALTQLDNLMQL